MHREYVLATRQDFRPAMAVFTAALERLGKRIEAATDLALRFMNAAEEFIVAVLNSDGWKTR